MHSFRAPAPTPGSQPRMSHPASLASAKEPPHNLGLSHRALIDSPKQRTPERLPPSPLDTDTAVMPTLSASEIAGPAIPRTDRSAQADVHNAARATEPEPKWSRDDSKRSFPASIWWAAAGTIMPGLGLTRTRFKKSGFAMLSLFLISGAGGAFLAKTSPTMLLSAAVNPAVLTFAALALVTFGVVWAGSIAVTQLALRPRWPTRRQRTLGGIAIAVLTATVLLPTVAGARVLHDTSTTITGIFGEQPAGGAPAEDYGNAIDPWANKPRLNLLILGGDSGQHRPAAVGARTDTVILASMDTKTGDTVLFSLPRQTQRIPFPQGSPLAKRWPNGFTNGTPNDAEYFLNAIYHNVPRAARGAFPAGVEDPGAYALKEGVGTALGLPIDYYLMINMDGFIQLIDALGGITVNISSRVPVGGKTTGNVQPDRWIAPGRDRHLNGFDALWYARGRYGSATGDYDRMGRQRCVVQAVVKQANPTTVLANYEALTKAGRNILSTDAPTSKAPALIALALKVKNGTMTSVSFENDKDGFSTVRPNWVTTRARVQAAINPPAKDSPVHTPASEPSGAPAATSSVVDECAYNPR